MKAIIVAAGRGRRLGPETDEIPKCMVRVGGRAILHRQADALWADDEWSIADWTANGWANEEIQVARDDG